MCTIIPKNVVVVGAAGNLGKHILAALLADKSFNVTVLSRIDSANTFPSDTTVLKVDYSNKAALSKALTGQDVIISAVSNHGDPLNIDVILAETAMEVGVKWMIPSEFGIDTEHPSLANNPIVAPKIAVVDLLQKNRSRLAYTLLSTGVFLDWGLDNGLLGFDISNRTATLYDEGKNLFSGTTLPHIGQAVVTILQHPELTQNKRIYIADVTFTQQQLLSLLEKYTGAQFTTKQVFTENLRKQGEECFASGNFTQGIFPYILNLIFNGKGAASFESKTSNNALGLETCSLEQIVKEGMERQSATM